MLSKVTWGEFWMAILLLAFAYYVVVILVYYRQELKEFLRGKFKTKRVEDYEEFTTEEEPEGDTDFDELEVVVSELRSAVLERAGMGANRHMLLSQLKHRLSGYAGMKRPAYRVAINNYIIQHAKEICGVAFSEEELEAEWGMLPR